MKEKRLLYAIGWVKDVYIEEMQQRTSGRYSRRKLWLVAAVIAALLILAGCVAVFLRLQDMSIGKETYTQYFDDQGRYSGPAEKEKDIITLTGYADSPTQKAFREWYEFRESYDPNRELLTNEPNLPDIPDAEEAVYGCYTQEMVEKLHEIADKYGLQLLDVYTPIQKYQSSIALKALGVDSLLKPNAPAQMGDVSGLLYSPYNFKLTYDVTIDGLDTYLVGQYYHRNGYFPRNAAGYYDLSQWQQWNYTTQDGVKLLLALSSKGKAEIIADLGHGFLSIGFDSYDGPSLYPQPDEIITKEELEQAAEVFAYDLPFLEIDIAAIQPELDAAEASYQAAHPPRVLPTYPDYDGYMEMAGVWMGPEGYDYCFYDWDEDGTEELWIGYNGAVNRCIIMEGGEAKEKFPFGYLCAGGVRHDIFQPEFSSYELHQYFGKEGCVLTLAYYLGNWYNPAESMDYANLVQQPTITEAQAKTLMAQYPHLELPWQSVLTYTLADGRVIRDLIPEPEIREPLRGDALRRAYGELIVKYDWYRYCALRDINGDGVTDLLVSEKEGYFQEAYSTENGEVISMDTGRYGESYLCEGNIVETQQIYGMTDGVELMLYAFYHLSPGREPELVDHVFYNKAAASWQSDMDGTPVAEGEARRILGKYTRIPMDMGPAAQLLG